MKRTVVLLWIALVVIICGAGTARAQDGGLRFGFGLGVAAAGENVEQAGGELGELFSQDSIQYDDVSGDIGFYVSGRAVIDLDPIRILGDASYVYFQAKEITLTDADVNPDSTVSATFEVGTSMIPIAVGAAFALPTPVVKPYVGAQFSYTFVSRTYAFVRGGEELEDRDLQNKSAGDPEAGVAISAGAEVGLGFAKLDIGGRYNLSNLFTKDEAEQPMRFLQAGVSLFF